MPDINVLRLLDACINRAREALRVLEDYARFVVDDAEMSRSLKHCRHELATATESVQANAIVWRDTGGDVGASIKTNAELIRGDVGDVVIAAGKRLGEALRSIEEYLKTIDPDAAQRVEAIRYQFYPIEQQVHRMLRPAERFESVRLYVLITESVCKRPWLEAAAMAIDGGADCLQLREKNLEGAELLRRAKQLVALTRKRQVLCIVNDRADVAMLSDADGVHVGQGDLPAREARKVVGANKFVGVSTHEIGQARQAVADGADYLGVGPFFRSETKPREFCAGPDYAREAVAAIRIPLVAIAGISAANVGEVTATGVKAIAVTAAVVGADDPAAAARELKRRLLV